MTLAVAGALSPKKTNQKWHSQISIGKSDVVSQCHFAYNKAFLSSASETYFKEVELV